MLPGVGIGTPFEVIAIYDPTVSPSLISNTSATYDMNGGMGIFTGPVGDLEGFYRMVISKTPGRDGLTLIEDSKNLGEIASFSITLSGPSGLLTNLSPPIRLPRLSAFSTAEFTLTVGDPAGANSVFQGKIDMLSILGGPGCAVNVTKESQGASDWNPSLYPSNYVSLWGLVNPWGASAFSAFHAYDFSFSCPNSNGTRAACTSSNFTDMNTLAGKGCALTSLHMALANKNVAFAPFKIPLIPAVNAPEIDIPLDPGSMNLWMTGNGGFTTNGKVKWDTVTRGLGAPRSLKFDTSNWNSSDPDVLAAQVCQGDKGQIAPVVVGVNIRTVESPPGSGNFVSVPGHFVLVTGATQNLNGTSTFTIADPAGRGQTLDTYANNFRIRGLVTDPLDASGLDIYAGDEVEILVTDPLGRKIGFDPSTATDFREISTAAYFRDSLNDDVTGTPDQEISHSVEINQPSAGIYRITATGLKASSYLIDIHAFATDGSALTPLTVSGISGSGSTGTVDINLAPTPDGVISATRVASYGSTLGDIANSLQLTLIDNQGIANALSSKIEAASAASDRRDYTSERNNLNAFIQQVNAQANKHIKGIAPEVLLADSDSSPKGFRRVFNDEIRLNSLPFDTFAPPRVPTCDGHAKHVSTTQFEIGSSENLTCGSGADECGEVILLRKAGDHLRRAVRTGQPGFNLARLGLHSPPFGICLRCGP